VLAHHWVDLHNGVLGSSLRYDTTSVDGDVGRGEKGWGESKGQGSSLPLEAARAINWHIREICRAVGSHTGLVRTTCLIALSRVAEARASRDR
jgi:hypothetical protein